MAADELSPPTRFLSLQRPLAMRYRARGLR
jgi:hypothetical protein